MEGVRLDPSLAHGYAVCRVLARGIGQPAYNRERLYALQGASGRRQADALAGDQQGEAG